MDRHAIEEQYLKITKIFAYLSGTWPYQKTSLKVAIAIITLIVTSSHMAVQIAQVIHISNVDIVIEQFPFIAVAAGLSMKQIWFIMFQTELRTLLNGMYEDWSIERSKEEIVIMTEYANRAIFFIRFYTVVALSSSSSYMVMPYVSRVMDKLKPLNESREPLFIYTGYYPFDGKNHFYLVANHMATLLLSILVVFTAADTTFIYLVQHACGLLEVSGYRFKNAIQETSAWQEKITTVVPAEYEYKKVCSSIQAHERSIAYLNEIHHIFVIYFFIFMTLVTIAFSVTLVKLSELEINGNTECLYYSTFLFIQLVHIFFMVCQGQFVINASDSVYQQIYEGLWYNSPSRTQVLYVLALRRSLTSPQITAGGLVTFSLESFSTIMKTSVSYFTVLKSM